MKEQKKKLQFNLSIKEYSDFWYIGSLLKLNKKNDILLKMMNIIKETTKEENCNEEKANYRNG